MLAKKNTRLANQYQNQHGLRITFFRKEVDYSQPPTIDLTRILSRAFSF